MTQTLLQDAVQKVSDPFDKLLSSIEKKRQALQTGMATQTYSLGEHDADVKKNLEDWRVNAKVRRLWDRDASL